MAAKKTEVSRSAFMSLNPNIKSLDISETGIIYFAHNKIEGKGYCGAVHKTQGTNKRWLTHISEAFNDNVKSGCRELNDAIRQFGKEGFIVCEIGECPLDELDYWEAHFIKHLHTLHPSGYNLTTGGGKFKKYVEESKKRNTAAQMGNRREIKDRKYEGDEDLPKNITSLRKNGKLIGYMVNNFSVGLTDRKYVSKKFLSDKLTIEEKLILAKVHLRGLIEEYNDVFEQLEQKRGEKMELPELDIVLPKYIKISKKNPKAYILKKYTDSHGSLYEKIVFDDNKNGADNLKELFLFVHKINLESSVEEFIIDYEKYGLEHSPMNTNLPKYISIEKNANGEEIGYFINNFPLMLPDGTTKKTKKKFCSKKEPSSVKLKYAVEYLSNLYKLNQNEKNKQ